jgi:hypothetical protein
MGKLQKELDNYLMDVEANLSRVKTRQDALSALLAIIEDTKLLLARL